LILPVDDCRLRREVGSAAKEKKYHKPSKPHGFLMGRFAPASALGSAIHALTALAEP
jgi:hypothetical protein